MGSESHKNHLRSGNEKQTLISLALIDQMHCFQVLDQRGVGQLIKMATEKGRAAKPSLKVNGSMDI